ncbi:MAG: DUF4314 domain-containing protein [Clostridium sp.]
MCLDYDEKKVEMLRKRYPKGTPVCLDSMDGESQMSAGLKGEVLFVDDAGQIHVGWENGSFLALVPQVDRFHTAAPPEKKHEKGEPSR